MTPLPVRNAITTFRNPAGAIDARCGIDATVARGQTQPLRRADARHQRYASPLQRRSPLPDLPGNRNVIT
jgi:hypothetical protein